MKSFACFLFVSAAAVACTTTAVTANPAGSTSPTETVSGAEKIGVSCTGGCGGNLGLDCAVPSADTCGGGWCFVDLSTGALRSYCTTDCSSAACPAGYRCGALDVIGIDGAQQGCIAAVAECGNGVKELGEICEKGETSSEGTCKDDCSGWKEQRACGDGIVQPGEACEVDTKNAYCIDCALATPSLVLDATLKSTAEKWGPAGTTHDGSASGTKALPTAGDAKGCGRYAIVESTPELVRVELTQCSPSTATRATWSIAIPRTSMTLTASSDPKWRPTSKLEKTDGSATISYPSVAKLTGKTVAAEGHHVLGQYAIELVFYDFGGGGRANLDLDFDLLPPPP